MKNISQFKDGDTYYNVYCDTIYKDTIKYIKSRNDCLFHVVSNVITIYGNGCRDDSYVDSYTDNVDKCETMLEALITFWSFR